MASSPQPEVNLDQRGDTERPIVPARTAQRARRDQVPAACLRCRQHKVKCDAQRPCWNCAKRYADCVYDEAPGMTVRQANQRRERDLLRTIYAQQEILQIMATGNKRDAWEVFHRLRAGQQVVSILDHIKAKPAIQIPRSPTGNVETLILVSLAHSSASLGEITTFAIFVLQRGANRLHIAPTDFARFRNRVIHLPELRTILMGRIHSEPVDAATHMLPSIRRLDLPAAPAQESVALGPLSFDELHPDSDPPYRVPATPWTVLDVDDAVVSHLVSLFLVWMNSSYGFVEPDLFVSAMRSKHMPSKFCSPLLVNSVLALASLHSEHDAAFSPGEKDRLTRGIHFHDEALRLWSIEEGRATICNIQALCILALESNFRAKDQLGEMLITAAARLDERIPLAATTADWQTEGWSRADCERGRLSAHILVRVNRVMIRLSTMRNTNLARTAATEPNIAGVFQDINEIWTGYPLLNVVVPFRPRLCLEERYKLSRVLNDATELLLDRSFDGAVTTGAFVESVEKLTFRLSDQRENFPPELRYAWPMAVCVWELHASSYTSQMLVLLTSISYLRDGKKWAFSGLTAQEYATETAHLLQAQATGLAQRFTKLLRDYRQRWGLKIAVPWLLQGCVVAASILVRDPIFAEKDLEPLGRQPQAERVTQSNEAFDEVFRCLLGCGVDYVIVRGIARTMCHAALQRRIALSETTRTWLQVISDTAWRPRDLSLLQDCNFPSFATSNDFVTEERLADCLRRLEQAEI